MTLNTVKFQSTEYFPTNWKIRIVALIILQNNTIRCTRQYLQILLKTSLFDKEFDLVFFFLYNIYSE